VTRCDQAIFAEHDDDLNVYYGCSPNHLLGAPWFVTDGNRRYTVNLVSSLPDPTEDDTCTDMEVRKNT